MTGPILIQGAMDVETDRAVGRLENCQEEIIAGFRFWYGRYAGLDLVVSRTEVGMVSAAAATILGIQRFTPSLVLNQGTAGAHRSDLHVGDIVVGRTCVDIQSVLVPKRGAGEGMDPAAWTLWDFDADTPPVFLEGDARWAERFEAAPYAGGRVVSGRLGTGDVFNREHDRILWLRAQAGEDCEDMESLAAYRVCRRFAVPCLGMRIISNNELTGEPYCREVGENLQDFILPALAGLGDRP
ncbi:5'-methylthioadenosine/S-adenosylhomocysteine nucleosidase [Intestinimonas timonensis]|uniref:5'-methylthioadenosine/S-adenosylhomocysteine nucleosidase n=1 Tax=Intestinimonas timonensis TaxID=1689270 RepID=UPI0013EF5963|nr:5'-methylthioadenosine/S-adenosylhomocysteine nucleosidase [Intestinimonas timonensis]